MIMFSLMLPGRAVSLFMLKSLGATHQEEGGLTCLGGLESCVKAVNQSSLWYSGSDCILFKKQR